MPWAIPKSTAAALCIVCIDTVLKGGGIFKIKLATCQVVPNCCRIPIPKYLTFLKLTPSSFLVYLKA